MLTFSSLFRELVIASNKLSIALVESDFDKPAEEATEAIRSFLFTFNSFDSDIYAKYYFKAYEVNNIIEIFPEFKEIKKNMAESKY